MPVKLSHDASALPQKVTMKGSAARWLAGQEMMPQALLRLDGVPAAEELEPLAQGDTELRQTLKMLASLNDTSLYASFFIS